MLEDISKDSQYKKPINDLLIKINEINERKLNDENQINQSNVSYAAGNN